MASMGLPGFGGFIAELMVLVGVLALASPSLRFFVGIGIVVGVAYIWRAMQKAFFGEPAAASYHDPSRSVAIRSHCRSASGSVLLIAASITVGLYPQMLLRVIVPALNELPALCISTRR